MTLDEARRLKVGDWLRWDRRAYHLAVFGEELPEKGTKLAVEWYRVHHIDEHILFYLQHCQSDPSAEWGESDLDAFFDLEDADDVAGLFSFQKVNGPYADQ